MSEELATATTRQFMDELFRDFIDTNSKLFNFIYGDKTRSNPNLGSNCPRQKKMRPLIRDQEMAQKKLRNAVFSLLGDK